MIIQNHSALERASFYWKSFSDFQHRPLGQKFTAASVGKRTLFVYRDKRIIFEVKV